MSLGKVFSFEQLNLFLHPPTPSLSLWASPAFPRVRPPPHRAPGPGPDWLPAVPGVLADCRLQRRRRRRVGDRAGGSRPAGGQDGAGQDVRQPDGAGGRAYVHHCSCYLLTIRLP